MNAPASRTFEHCREWVRAGHRVTVMTCVPNFPNGRVYAGYKNKLVQTEHMEGIQVVRVWSFITANEGFVKRILDYVSFMVSALVVSPRVKAPDLVISTSPQFFSACAAYLISLPCIGHTGEACPGLRSGSRYPENLPGFRVKHGMTSWDEK